MRGERNTDRNTRKFITIKDINIWEQIDQIMTLPEYEKSFNKVVNEALFYGIEILFNEVFKIEKPKEEKKETPLKTDEESLSQIIRLLKEIIVNETINKSILCSLFQIKNLELNQKVVSGKKFEEGYYRDTPDYLIQYELKALKENKE